MKNIFLQTPLKPGVLLRKTFSHTPDEARSVGLVKACVPLKIDSVIEKLVPRISTVVSDAFYHVNEIIYLFGNQKMCVIYIFSLSIGIDINFVYIFYVVESSTSSSEVNSRIRCRIEYEKACGTERDS